MAYQIVNIGAAPDDGTGDVGRDAFQKLNSNFSLTQIALDGLQLSINGRAPLVSPGFSGAPAVPTAPPGTNTTQIASTAFVSTELGNYYTQGQVNATFATLASPTFTGTVAVPTPGAGDNSNKATNTAWVINQLSTYVPVVPNGSVVGSAYAEYTANANLTTTIPADDTIPQSTEGTEVVSLTYATSSASNKVRVRFIGQVNASVTVHVIASLIINSGPDAVRATATYVDSAGGARIISLEYEYSPLTTTARTYSIRIGPISAATVRLNGSFSGRWFGGASAATLTISEIKA